MWWTSIHNNLFPAGKRAKGLPDKVFWNKENISLRKFKFDYSKNENKQIYEILEYYHRYGFAIVSALKPEDGEIINFAKKIGYIRETNFGKLFNVKSQKQPNDLAYTSIELESHTDNPYRKPVPSWSIYNPCSHLSPSAVL